MKVLLANISGNTGSTGKITSDIKDYLQSVGKEAVIAHPIADIQKDGYYKISKRWELALALRLTKLGRCMYKGNPWSFGRIKNIIEKEHPDIVHIHCINCQCVNVYSLLKYLAYNRIKTIITHHAEFFYTGSCSYAYECLGFSENQCRECTNPQKATLNKIFPQPYNNWKRMYDAINSFQKSDLEFVAVSPWVKKRSLQSPIVNKYNCDVVFNGLDIDTFYFHENTWNILGQIPQGNKTILHVTSLFDPSDKENIKGGYYVVQLASMMPETTFVVVSSTYHNVENLPYNIKLWGKASSQEELAQLYSIADVTLLTSRRETFSMVTAESLCCGTPVVGFEAGGPESIALSEFSRFVKAGDLNELISKIVECYSFVEKEYISKKSREIYSKEHMGSSYLKIYNKMIGNINGNQV